MDVDPNDMGLQMVVPRIDDTNTAFADLLPSERWSTKATISVVVKLAN